MKPSEIFDVMDIAKRARDNNKIFNPLFISPPGLGKTEIVEQWCQQNGYQYVPFSLATSDAPDFKGFPQIKEVNGRAKMTFATPEIWPESGKGVIVLEELNRTTTATMQCVLSLGDKRRGFDGYKLPDGWIIAACVNPDDGYDTTAMDPALKDRFEFFAVHYDRVAHVNYMKSTTYDPRIINFVEARLWDYVEPGNLGTIPGAKYVSPRTFSKLDAALSTNLMAHLELPIYEEILGTNVGKAFYAFCHDEAPVTYEDLVESTSRALKKLKRYADPHNYKPGMISITTKSIVEHHDISNELLIQVLETIPVDQGSPLLNQIEIARSKASGNEVKANSIMRELCSIKPSLKDLFKEIYHYGK